MVRLLGVRRRGALEGISIDLCRGEFLAILGPRGSGKTSLLRAIAGHDRLDEGVIYLAGVDATHVPPDRRPVNLLSRRPALFPHLNARENIAFGLRYTGASPGEQAGRVARAIEALGLAGLEERRPAELTIEQAHQVAMARALVLENPVLLADEALGELDPPARRQVAAHLKHLQQRAGLTIVMAMREAEEALALAGRILVLNRGRIEQVGPAGEVYERPATALVAEMVGAGNFMGARVTRSEGAIVTVASAAGFQTVILGSAGALSSGDAVRFVVRPERLQMRQAEPDPASALACMEATLEQRIAQGAATAWIVRNRAGERLVVRQNGSDGDFVIMGKAWVCWDPRDAVMVRA